MSNVISASLRRWVDSKKPKEFVLWAVLKWRLFVAGMPHPDEEPGFKFEIDDKTVEALDAVIVSLIVSAMFGWLFLLPDRSHGLKLERTPGMIVAGVLSASLWLTALFVVVVVLP